MRHRGEWASKSFDSDSRAQGVQADDEGWRSEAQRSHRRGQPPGRAQPAPRAELLHVLMLPHFEPADRIGEFWGNPESRAFAELLIDWKTGRSGPSSSGCCGRATDGLDHSMTQS
jgi:hypothetical protein